jgi:hypothetical protein
LKHSSQEGQSLTLVGETIMAKAKQFTIAVQNEPGAVAGIAKTLGDAKVNILALLAIAQGANGTVELVVDNAARARKALADAKITFQETVADEYELPNKPGALAQCLDGLAAKGINLNSICATVSKGGRKVVVICGVGSKAKAAAAKAKTATASGR